MAFAHVCLCEVNEGSIKHQFRSNRLANHPPYGSLLAKSSHVFPAPCISGEICPQHNQIIPSEANVFSKVSRRLQTILGGERSQLVAGLMVNQRLLAVVHF